MIVNKLTSLVAGSLLLIGAASNANATVYNFTDTAGTASLSIVETSATTFNFTFSFLTSSSGNFSYIDLLAIDATPNATVSLSSFSGSGVGTPTVLGAGATPASFNYDFGFDFANTGTNRLQVGETASWTTTFSAAPTSFNNIALVYRNNGGQNPTQLFAQAVPEPETYAMFLAGLGLLGFAARRKQA